MKKIFALKKIFKNVIVVISCFAFIKLNCFYPFVALSAGSDNLENVKKEIQKIDQSNSKDSFEGSILNEFQYYYYFLELPLYKTDYYYGKFINAAAAVNELNKMPALMPGDKVSLIKDGYLTFSVKNGYIYPGEGYYYASGSCWVVSTLGAMMDEANKHFERKYSISLFVFNYGDRLPHKYPFKTYTNSNFGYGYTVYKASDWTTDYSFTINPEIAKNKDLKNLRIKIYLFADSKNPEAYLGQSIGAYIMTNLEI